ncbi:hypothetical protein K523DRAFT_387803 [Schizophyllum commune Tattone D]|uniref:uncharacterized protein n=1 Tax=Schizophyllum commune (strain H4-8 / FGSC 9210) TaxID=578458 RepID=UPI00215F4399|nr:uncharacterized protein SCHCODRAFT_02486224 [Schizophyllum commune H4-8]KAI5828562.1 hypothetical protein K523DRAFT_387803 [Schizophyllum commune Tattone D]KAI5897437.1 hypothetical protein SCHCODRAFT_02486224 [Schizophyllum commune H4-8]
MFDTLVRRDALLTEGPDLKCEQEACARRLRDKDKPFGGIQLVFCGDFFQLPPVQDKPSEPIKFAFEAASWKSCMGPPIVLDEVFRQKEQPLVDMLNEARFGKLKRETIQAFRQLSRPVQYTDDIEPTRLFATNAEVDAANLIRLRKLPGPGTVFSSTDTAGLDGNGEPLSEKLMLSSLRRNTIAPKDIELRVCGGAFHGATAS